MECDGSGKVKRVTYTDSLGYKIFREFNCPGCRKCRPCTECGGVGLLLEDGVTMGCDRCGGFGAEPEGGE